MSADSAIKVVALTGFRCWPRRVMSFFAVDPRALTNSETPLAKKNPTTNKHITAQREDFLAPKSWTLSTKIALNSTFHIQRR